MNPTAAPTRVLARNVVWRGRRYQLSVVEIHDGEVLVAPFTRETPRTVFYPGTVTIVDTPAGPVLSYGG